MSPEQQNTKRVVIIGGPGTGKTTLIHSLEEKGYACKHEISREVIKAAQKEGVEQLFLTDPILFSQKLLEGRLRQFKEAQTIEAPLLFYDRGLPDVPIYMDYLGTKYPHYFIETCKRNTYDTIFLLPPWKEIYQQDSERYESFDIATKLYSYLKKGYQNFGYTPVEVPIGSVENRLQFIETQLQLP